MIGTRGFEPHNLRVYKFLARNLRLHLLFKKHLKGHGQKLLDIGCAPGRWLEYFKNEYGFDIYGIDYNEDGVKRTNKYLAKFGLRGKIFCEDVRSKRFQNQFKEYFDVVCSMGVVEHYTDPTEMFDVHRKLLKKGGLLIITIPNYGDGTIARFGQRIHGLENNLLETHNVGLMNIQKYAKYLEKFPDLKIMTLNYFGPYDLDGLIRPFRSSKVLIFFLYLLNQIIGYFTLFINSKRFACQIVLLAHKH